MSDNPFSEPGDEDRTVARPGGVRPQGPPGYGTPPAQPAWQQPGAHSFQQPMQPPPQQPQQQRAATPIPGGPDSLPRIGINPLAAAAAPLLSLIARMGVGQQAMAARPPDASEMRERALRELRAFETAAQAAEIPAEHILAAHYGLCATLDDVVLAMPWVAGSAWQSRSLVSTFHQEVRSGERFFDMLETMQREPGRWLPVLEVFYLCLSLGMLGKYRLMRDRNGQAELDRLREGVYGLIARQRGGFERELAGQWRGVDAPHEALRRGIPNWVAGTLALLLLAIGWVFVSQSINASTDGLFARMNLPPGHLPEIIRQAPPVPPAPPPPSIVPPRPDALARLRSFLAPEIRQGLVTVNGSPQRISVSIRSSGMFASGSGTVEMPFLSLLARIGVALRDEPGNVEVLGHTDNQPIRSVRFPSNFHLSTARAEAAMALINAALGQPGRLRAQGRADAEPLADNATPAGREQNRRIEIVLTPGTV